MNPHESIKPPRQHRKSSTLKTQLPFCSSLRTGAALFIGAVLLAGASLMAAEQNDSALLAKLEGSKHSLADGIKQSEKENGSAISPKFEMDGEKLMLSVYTAKAGLGKDSEHNALIELAWVASEEVWKPETEVFDEKKHLTRASMQLTLTDAIQKAEGARAGTVYSVIPATKEGKPVFDVLVATAEGKSILLTVDGESGETKE